MKPNLRYVARADEATRAADVTVAP
jgi:hypothetical protein